MDKLATTTTRPLAARGLHSDPIHLMVMHDGEVMWDYRPTVMEIYGANLIVRRDAEGQLYAWKDRYDLVRALADLTAKQAGVLAALHLLIVSGAKRRDIELAKAAALEGPAPVKLLGE